MTTVDWIILWLIVAGSVLMLIGPLSLSLSFPFPLRLLPRRLRDDLERLSEVTGRASRGWRKGNAIASASLELKVTRKDEKPAS